jgi:hypothetical protein
VPCVPHAAKDGHKKHTGHKFTFFITVLIMRRSADNYLACAG